MKLLMYFSISVFFLFISVNQAISTEHNPSYYRAAQLIDSQKGNFPYYFDEYKHEKNREILEGIKKFLFQNNFLTYCNIQIKQYAESEKTKSFIIWGSPLNFHISNMVRITCHPQNSIKSISYDHGYDFTIIEGDPVDDYSSYKEIRNMIYKLISMIKCTQIFIAEEINYYGEHDIEKITITSFVFDDSEEDIDNLFP